MTLSIETVFRVLDACLEQKEQEAVISLVFPYRGFTSCQIYLPWKQGRMLRDYILDPALQGKLSTWTARHTRIMDQRGIHRRLTYIPQQFDELRFLRVRAGGV